MDQRTSETQWLMSYLGLKELDTIESKASNTFMENNTVEDCSVRNRSVISISKSKGNLVDCEFGEGYN